jgi:hypothetical protein
MSELDDSEEEMGAEAESDFESVDSMIDIENEDIESEDSSDDVDLDDEDSNDEDEDDADDEGSYF